MQNSFSDVINKIKIESDIRLNNIQNCSIKSDLENELDLKIGHKLTKCKTIMFHLKNISSEFKSDFDQKERIIIKAEPIKGREKEFIKLKNEFNQCVDKFYTVEELYEGRINFMKNKIDDMLKECLINNCEKNFKIDKKIEETENCVRDCYDYNINNLNSLNRLVTDEYYKYISDIEKL